MAKNNFYGVRYGVNPKTGEEVKNQIFEKWSDVLPLITKVKGAEYKGFVTREEVETYVSTRDPLFNKKENMYPKDCMHFYVDGSCTHEGDAYSYGVAYVDKEQVAGWEYGKSTKETSMRQIGGELLGAMKALMYAKSKGIKKLVIFHDYKGVCYHATGYWKRDNQLNEKYYQWCQKYFLENPDIEVIFCKVDAHDKDPFNEIADGLAKLAIGLKPEPISVRMAEKYGVSPLLNNIA